MKRFIYLFKFLALIGCSFLLLPQCSDPSDECKYKKESEVRLPDQILDMFYFKKGSYWILKNESTGETDSIWVRKEPVFEIMSHNIGSGVFCMGGTSISTGYGYLDSAKIKAFGFYIQKSPTYSLAYGLLFIDSCSNTMWYDLAKEEFNFEVLPCSINNGTLLKNLTINQTNYNRVFKITNFGFKYDTLFWAEKAGCVQAYKKGIRYSLIRKNIN